jgi:hypothetical protein
MGVGQTGKTLLVDGLPVSQAGWLLPGDYFQVGVGGAAHLHRIVSTVNANGAGQATLEFWPRLRTTPSDNAPLTLDSPQGIWRLSSNDTEWSVGLSLIYGLRFGCREAL